MDLVELAERVGSAADLDDQARGRFALEMEFGDSAVAVGIATLETRVPPFRRRYLMDGGSLVGVA